jgi:hypothetical protein
MNIKRIIGFIAGLASLGLQVPGLLMVFSAPGGWNLALVILIAFILATAIIAIIAAIFSVTGFKKARGMFVCGGIVGVLTLALAFFLLLSIELIVITEAFSAIILFVSAKVVSAERES